MLFCGVVFLAFEFRRVVHAEAHLLDCEPVFH
jgi:hypothetical protein